jgi:adenylate cyclase
MGISFKRWKTGLKSFCLVATVVVIFAEVPYLNQFVEQAEQISLDMRYRNFNRLTRPSQQVILVDIDEETLNKYAPVYGRWPWPRKAHKEIISFIGEGNPSMTIFDVLFTEPQQESDDDQILAEVSAHYKNVSHASLLLPESGLEDQKDIPLRKDRAFPNPLQWKSAPSRWFSDSKYHAVSLPNPTLWTQTENVHSANVEPDSDGILRRVPMAFLYDQTWIPSLAMRGILSQSLNAQPRLALNGQSLEVYETETSPKRQIPLDDKGTLFLHYYADSRWFNQVSAAAILDSAIAKEAGNIEGITIDPEMFKDKVVIIGTSAMALNDLKVTPIGKQYPGALLHATAISNVLLGDYLREAPRHTTLWLSLLLVFICYFSIFFVDSFFVRNVFPPLSIFATTVLSSVYYFNKESYHIPMALPVIAALGSLLHGYLHMAIIETRQRKMIQGTLSKYLSPAVTQHLIDSGINPTAEVGKWREISILFSDIRGFTSLSETIAPDFLVRVLNEYLGEMTDIIFDHEGTLDKFIGDAVMAFWGAPIDDKDHARKSVSTAIHMVRAVDTFNERNRKDGYPPLKIGVGVHTGKAIVGNIGSNKRLDYTIIGDNVNLASRLEGLTKEYGLSLLISGPTYELIKDHFICRPIDVVVAKGKTQSVPLFQPLIERKPGPDAAKWEALCYLYNDAYKLYQQGQFTWALESFRKILEKHPQDGPTLTFIERCEVLAKSPPVDWQGVFVATKK